MYKVLIVDDEVLVRIGLKTTIDWEQYGFEIIAEANNGAQGFIEYEKHQPDVVFTDIKMPHEDGLWLTEKIKKQAPETYVILLTCFDEFDMVRKSLKVGADDYILKTELENEDLEDNLKKIKSHLDKKNGTGHRENDGNSQSIKRTLMNDMINNEMQIDKHIEKRLHDVGFHSNGSRYCLVGFHLSQRPISAPDKKVNIKQISKALKHIIIDKLEEQGIEYIFNSKQKSYLFILSKSDLNLSKIQVIGRFINQSAKNYFDIDLKVVYSAIYEDFHETSKRYMHFNKKKKIIFYSYGDGKKIFSLDEVVFDTTDKIKHEKLYNRKILASMSELDFIKTESLLEEVVLECKSSLIEPEATKIFFSTLVRDVLLTYRHLRQYSDKIKRHVEWNDLILKATYVEDVQKLVHELFGEIENALKKSKSSNVNSLSHLAVEYIERHYKENISLEDVAIHLAVSKHYLSSVFKKEVGVNMSTYINEKKIHAVKECIDIYDLKNKEIFEAVGFSNQQYLSKVFKKVTGMTIKEYRASRQMP